VRPGACFIKAIAGLERSCQHVRSPSGQRLNGSCSFGVAAI
jgi:hypothetical protein